jgi:hypothetical protein
MKTKLVTVLCVAALLMTTVPEASALEDGSPEAIAADVLVARPACFVATVVGTGVFVLALPFAALGGNVKRTARTLVTGPGRLTFVRPVGDFSDFTP